MERVILTCSYLTWETTSWIYGYVHDSGEQVPVICGLLAEAKPLSPWGWRIDFGQLTGGLLEEVSIPSGNRSTRWERRMVGTDIGTGMERAGIALRPSGKRSWSLWRRAPPATSEWSMVGRRGAGRNGWICPKKLPGSVTC
jgi:hypothetical protein